MVFGHRLKPYDASDAAGTRLREGDLFRLSWLPVSHRVHLITVIGGPSGAIEYGEYIVGGNASHFSHSAFTLAEVELVEAQRTLVALSRQRAPRWSSEDSEEPERRVISLWVAREERSYYLPRASLYRRLRISAEFKGAFEDAWQCLTELVQQRRVRDGLGAAQQRVARDGASRRRPR
jgi:hypothetical protein